MDIEHESVSQEVYASISYVIDRVAERGFEHSYFDVDRYSELVQKKQVQEAQILALYEEYFVPERHEFEWRILSDIVSTVTDPSFIASAIASGVLGNAVYDMMKHLLSFAVDKVAERLGEFGERRAQSFKQMIKDIERLQTFFAGTSKARIGDIEHATGISRERIYPLLKVAGFTHYRRGDPCFWEMV